MGRTPKPDTDIVIGFAGGYPSGGVVRTVLVLGVLALLLAQAWRSTQEIVSLGALVGLFVGTEAPTRFILARHWPIDILGGPIIGTFLLLAALPLVQRLDRRDARSAAV